MKYAIINYQQVKDTKRLDAEFFQIEALIEKLKNTGSVKLGINCSLITQGPNPVFVDSGIPCLTGRNIASGKVNFTEPDYITESTFKAYHKFHLKPNDILITLKGAGSTGKAALYNSTNKAIFSRNL